MWRSDACIKWELSINADVTISSNGKVSAVDACFDIYVDDDYVYIGRMTTLLKVICQFHY